MDRAYIDFERLFLFSLCSAFFVVRAKKNVVLRRRYSRRVDTTTGLRSDQTVILTTNKSAKTYPDPLRRISYFDAGTNKRLKFLTNNFALPALTITQIYKSRWQVELFFKWIKQHLRIKSFYGTSENAVKTQIWIAISVYVHVAIIRKRLGIDRSLYQILQILSITILEKQPFCRPFTRLIPNSMNSKILTSWFYSTSNRTLVKPRLSRIGHWALSMFTFFSARAVAVTSTSNRATPNDQC